MISKFKLEMKEIFEKYKIKLEKEELKKFELFLDIFIKKNNQINLSSIRDSKEIIEKHFIDSIMLNKFINLDSYFKHSIEKKIKIADVWTWWWFPWIPLAITNPKINFTLIDSTQKKIKSVEEFAKKLKLFNVSLISARAEDLWRNLKSRNQFDFVISRATAILPVLLEYVVPLLRIGGIFSVYKLNSTKELENSENALKKLGAKVIKIKKYSLGEQERILIFIQKIKTTPKKYPRKVWIPTKNPL